jgi:hypothetical protein
MEMLREIVHTSDRMRSCTGGRHRDAARLGESDGTEWWHCRACGEIWSRGFNTRRVVRWPAGSSGARMQ